MDTRNKEELPIIFSKKVGIGEIQEVLSKNGGDPDVAKNKWILRESATYDGLLSTSFLGKDSNGQLRVNSLRLGLTKSGWAWAPNAPLETDDGATINKKNQAIAAFQKEAQRIFSDQNSDSANQVLINALKDQLMELLGTQGYLTDNLVKPSQQEATQTNQYNNYVSPDILGGRRSWIKRSKNHKGYHQVSIRLLPRKTKNLLRNHSSESFLEDKAISKY